MAQFKICRGTSEKLKDLALHDGYCYFTTDEQKFYIDYVNNDNELQRLPLNSRASVKLAGRVFENELSEVYMNYPTTRAVYDAIHDKVEGELEDQIDTFKKLRDLIKFFGDEKEDHELSNFEKLLEIFTEEGIIDKTLDDGSVIKALDEELTPRVPHSLFEEHLVDKNNPHEVTAAQLELGNVQNHSDEETEVSNEMREKLNEKLDNKNGEIGYIFTKEDDSYTWKKIPAVTKIQFNKKSLLDFVPTAENASPALLDASKATITLATTTGIVPRGEGSSEATIYAYSSDNIYETASEGYDSTYVNADVNVQMPFSIMSEKETNGEIGTFNKTFYTTVGHEMSIAAAIEIGNNLQQSIIASGTDAVILTADTESSTQAAAIIANQLDKNGMPVVLITTYPEVAQKFSINRIVTGINEAYVLGQNTIIQNNIINTAINALLTEVENSTVFDIYKDYCLEFSAPSTFSLKVTDPYWDGTMYYSLDKNTWNTWDGSAISSTSIYIRGSGNTRVSVNLGEKQWDLNGSNISCNGNIETLLDYKEVANGNHPAMASGCYEAMFYNCTNLITAPELPATTLTAGCYKIMFNGCTSLITIPELPATTLTAECYCGMFCRCSALKLSTIKTDEYTIPYRIPTSGSGIIDNDSLYIMFYNTGGTFANTPEINTIYYLHKDCGIVGEGTIIPSDCTQIEYIENDGDDYIDTGFTPNQDTRIDVTFIPSSNIDYNGNNAGLCVFSAAEAYDSRAFECYSWGGAMQVNYGSTYTNVVSSLTTGQIVNLTLNKNVCSGDVGGTAFNYTYSTQTFTCPYTLHLFGFSRGQDMGSSPTKLYSCKIYDNGVLIRDYIPILDASGTACLYDIVNKQTYYNAGTGNFSSPASEPEDPWDFPDAD